MCMLGWWLFTFVALISTAPHAAHGAANFIRRETESSVQVLSHGSLAEAHAAGHRHQKASSLQATRQQKQDGIGQVGNHSEHSSQSKDDPDLIEAWNDKVTETRGAKGLGQDAKHLDGPELAAAAPGPADLVTDTQPRRAAGFEQVADGAQRFNRGHDDSLRKDMDSSVLLETTEEVLSNASDGAGGWYVLGRKTKGDPNGCVGVGEVIHHNKECAVAAKLIKPSVQLPEIYIAGGWTHIPYGCSISSENNRPHQNNAGGINDGTFTSVCHSPPPNAPTKAFVESRGKVWLQQMQNMGPSPQTKALIEERAKAWADSTSNRDPGPKTIALIEKRGKEWAAHYHALEPGAKTVARIEKRGQEIMAEVSKLEARLEKVEERVSANTETIAGNISKLEEKIEEIGKSAAPRGAGVKSSVLLLGILLSGVWPGT
eukprot:TRINITY_DN63752_c0_g1_i1.p1 TRINITY_DN63752_c0_g1~~TRINITY_DN63752_c0_g1_i1.p1  ORF type:complete len:430 (+),score=60.29 TRINITY_DN63752_c0_g1_i1:61-1350(+)